MRKEPSLTQPSGGFFVSCAQVRMIFVKRRRTKMGGGKMTGEESRKLKSGDRVFWRDDLKNQGTVRGTSWSGVTIDWDDGESTSISHNDMTQVSRAPP
jgi:hypothetical protein